MSANNESNAATVAPSSAEQSDSAAAPPEAGEPREPREEELEDDARMSLLEHLQELRARLRNAAIAFVVALVASFYFVKDLYEILVRPVKLAMIDLGLVPEIHQQGIGTGFWTYFKLSIVVGILAASPLIFWELWKFVAPGLYKKERKLALSITGATAICFIGGALFGYQLLARTTCVYLLGVGDQVETQRKWDAEHRVPSEPPAVPPGTPAPQAGAPKPAAPPLPMDLVEKLRAGKLSDAEKAMLASRPVGLTNTLMVDHVLDFQAGLLLGCGVAFELPVVLALLGWIGLVSARGLWKFSKYALVLSAVVGGVLTPSPDAISQLMLAGPLYALYNISIGIVWLIERARKKREAEIEKSYAT